MNKKRYLLVDGIRGLAIINMVLFHFLYDVNIVYGHHPGWYGQRPVHIWQQAICWTFIFISGFVWQMGVKNNVRRGIFINLCGFLITAVTVLFMPSEAIWFGILNFIGCAVLVMAPLHKAVRRCPSGLGMLLSFLAFLIFKNVQKGYLGIGGRTLLVLPRWLYDVKVLTPFGFPYPGFSSGDYFPLLPWLFLFLTGYFFYSFFEKREALKKIAYTRIPVLSAIGKKSILIYMLHQPVCMLICIIWSGAEKAGLFF